MTEECFKTAFGEYHLERLPKQDKQPFRAWDAADEYLLSHLHDNHLLTESNRLLIINDSFGALSLSLHSHQSHNWSDSFVSHQACLHNFRQNTITQTPSLTPSTQEPQGEFDLVLIKIPKTLALLEDFLIHLRPHCHSTTQIIAAGMIKHLPKSALLLFEKIIGNTHTSLTKKKARLIFSQVNNSEKSIQSPYPKSYFEPAIQLELSNHANVFSKDKLDNGSRFLLEQFKQLPQAQHIVDLGCGNGVLGIVAQQQQPNATLSFLDESYMAIASAQDSYHRAFPDNTASFVASDCLNLLSSNADLILCNPPFHQQHSISDFIAWQMFSQSKQRLNEGGELWVVGNRHLNYHSKLKKLFGNCDLITSNRKFVVLRSRA